MSDRRHFTVCIETSVYFNVILENGDSCSGDHLKQLEMMQETGRITIFCPDVVQLELAKKLRGLATTVTEEVTRFHNAIEGVPEPGNKSSEIMKGIRSDLLAYCDKWVQDRLRECKERQRYVDAFVLKCKPVELCEDIFIAVKRRLIADKLPKINDKAQRDQDAHIIEALAYANRIAATEVLFCSLNHKDFAIEKEGKHAFAPPWSEDFPHWIYYSSLSLLVEALQSSTKLAAFLTPEEVDRAIAEKQSAEDQQQKANMRIRQISRILDMAEALRSAGGEQYPALLYPLFSADTTSHYRLYNLTDDQLASVETTLAHMLEASD